MGTPKQTTKTTTTSASISSRNIANSGDEFKYERIRKIGIGSYVSI